MWLSPGISLHSGDVARGHDGDLFGDAVNIASRLQGEAEPGQIPLSSKLGSELSEEHDLEDAGSRVLKHVAEPVPCLALARGGVEAAV